MCRQRNILSIWGMMILSANAFAVSGPCPQDLHLESKRVSQYCSGNLKYRIPVANALLQFSLIYNSLEYQNTGIFGSGFRASVDHRLSVNADGSLTFREGGGGYFDFEWNPQKSRFEPKDKRQSATTFTESSGDYIQKLPSGVLMRYKSYGSQYMLYSITSLRGHSLIYNRNASDGKLLSIDGLHNQKVHFDYSGDFVSSITATTNGEITSKYHLSYNQGRLQSVGASLETPEVPKKFWNFIYHPQSARLTAALSPDGTYRNFNYDSEGKLIKVSNRTGDLALIGYGPSFVEVKSPTFDYREDFNAEGYITKITTDGIETTFTYTDGQTTSSTSHMQQTVSYEYNGPHKYFTSKKTDSNGNWTELTYGDDWWKVEQIKSGKGTNIVTTADYTYNSSGFLEQQTVNGVSVVYTLNAFGNVLSESSPLGQLTYTYDDYGRVTSKTDYAGLQSTYTYNGAYIESVADHFGRKTNYNRDVRGYLSEVVFPDGTKKQFDFNFMGRLNESQDLDLLGNQISKVSYVRNYHADGRLSANNITAFGPLGFLMQRDNKYEHQIKEEMLTRVRLDNGLQVVDNLLDADGEVKTQPQPIPAPNGAH